MVFVGFEEQFFGELDNLRRQMEIRPLLLGGITGSGGGIPGRPGSFIGKLPQDRITYDLSELATYTTAGSPSLLDNLNHMRAGIGTISGVKNEGEFIGSNIFILDFDSNFIIAETPSGEANIELASYISVSGIDFDINVMAEHPHIEGRVDWNNEDHTLDVHTDLDEVTLQMNQEIVQVVHNGTGKLIPDGTVVRALTGFEGRISVTPALADTHINSPEELLVTTMDIPDGEIGFAVETVGKVRGLDLSSFNLGDRIWLSSTISGELTNVRPSFPAYARSIGGITVAGSEGTLQTRLTGKPLDTTLNFWNGIFRESIDFYIASDGVTISGTLMPANGHPDMTMIFSDGFTLLDTSPPANINLTPGTDENPQSQYVYIPKDTKVLTHSTADWPVDEHIKVASIALQSAATTQIQGALRNQNWNDHIQSTGNNQGHLSHIAEKIRQFEAQWHSGIELTTTIDTVPSPDAVYFSVTGGKVYQLHKQDFPALNMETGDDIHIVNDFTTSYKTLTDMSDQLEDASGNNLSNKYFSVVVWGVINKTGQTSHLMANMPTDRYNSSANAIADPNNYSVYSIPSLFKGVGFLIARVTFRNQANNWSLIEIEDLRGKIPNTTAGGGGGGGGVSSFLGLSDTPSAYSSQAYRRARVNEGETALEFIDDISSRRSWFL